MAKSSLASMTVEALIQLRDDVIQALSRRSAELQSQLAVLDDGGWISSGKKVVGRPRGSGSKLICRKVAPKYRNPANPSETWAGRGQQPRWLAAETSQGRQLEEFLIK